MATLHQQGLISTAAAFGVTLHLPKIYVLFICIDPENNTYSLIGRNV